MTETLSAQKSCLSHEMANRLKKEWDSGRLKLAPVNRRPAPRYNRSTGRPNEPSGP